MADKEIVHPASILKKKYGDITDKLESLEKEETTKGDKYYIEAIGHHDKMYDHGLGKAKELFKDFEKDAVYKNEKKAKELVTDMLLKYDEIANGKQHDEHFKKHLEGMDLDRKYEFARKLYSLRHGSSDKDIIGDIVEQFKRKEDKGTIQSLMATFGKAKGKHAEDASKYKLDQEMGIKYLDLENKNKDQIMHLAKHAAVLNNYDDDGSGNIHLAVLRDGIGTYQSIMSGKLDDKAEAALGLKKLKPSSKPKILQQYAHTA